MNRRWVILLAGGEGRRVRALTRDEDDRPAPKQFCRFGSDRTLLEQALDRAVTLTDEARVVAVVRSEHRRWWARDLHELSRENIIEAHADHGTAAAVLRTVRQVRSRDPLAGVVIIPADHVAEDETAFRDSIRRTADAVAEWPRQVILLGMQPDVAEEGYGWIVPSTRAGIGQTAAVVGFHEKPDPERARRLVVLGALVNTFVVAAAGAELESLYAHMLPGLVSALEPGTIAANRAARELHDLDISRDLFERVPHQLRVVRGARCGWSDLGTPTRLRAWLARGPSAEPKGRSHDLAHA